MFKFLFLIFVIQRRINVFLIMFFALSGAGIFLFWPISVTGAVEWQPEIRIFNNQNLSLEKSFAISEHGYNGVYSLAIIDLGGDGVNEIVVGAPAGERPEVKIYREDGSLINKFLAYGENFRGGVNVAVGDLDNDGKEEIITGAGFGGGPHIRVFDGFGNQKINEGFFAFDKNLRSGVRVAAGDTNGDGREEIIAGSGVDQKPQIKVFKNNGEFLFEINPDGINDWSGVNVASGDLDGDKVDEIIVGPGWGSNSEIKIWKGEKLVNKFLAYGENFRGGINLAAGDLENDGRAEIMVGAGFTGGPHVKIFDANGNNKISTDFFTYERGFRGGTLVGLAKFSDGKNKIISLQHKTIASGDKDFYKYLNIDISKQRMKFYENNFELGEHIISSGTQRMPTPLGTFKIFKKAVVAYSASYNLYMPHFMQFTKSGAAVHGLPYWQTAKGIVYEGVNHLGFRVSHGCVRLPLKAAEKIYGWADLNTSVVVHP
jgi:lipoprotein-anchoring transpeptidase ErfK/SrfK